MVSSIYLAAYTLIFMALTIIVIKHRRSKQISIFWENDKELAYKMRAHGNFAEYTPFAVILLYVLEFTGSTNLAIHAYGLTFLIARLLHAYSFIFIESIQEKPNRIFRATGIVLTIMVLLSASTRIVISTLF